MNGRDSFKRCKKCGKMIGIIKERAYRKIIVDAEAVEVMPDELGEIFVRHNGTKVRGREVKDMETYVQCIAGRTHEPAYRPHRCGVDPDEV